MTERDALRDRKSKQDNAVGKFSDSCSTEIDLKVQKRALPLTQQIHMRCAAGSELSQTVW